MATEYRPVTGQVLAASLGGICVIWLIALALSPGAGDLLGSGPWVVLAALLGWALFWRPRIIVDDSGVTLVNVLRAIRLPWPAIQQIDTRWSLTLHTAYGSYTAWAAPTGGRRAGRAVSQHELRHLPESELEGGVRVGDSPRSPSGRAALAIRERWELLRGAGYLDNPQLEFDHPPVHWHVGTMAAIAGLVVAGLAGALL